MTDTPSVRETITAAITHYLAVLEGRDNPTLSDLARALDRLVMTYHSTEDVEPDGDDDPHIDLLEEELRIGKAAADAFPMLGWYAVADPEDEPDQKVAYSISIGDLAEIATDLRRVLWLFENASFNDAVWDFRFGYQTHWGRHLHELRPYLHALAAW